MSQLKIYYIIMQKYKVKAPINAKNKGELKNNIGKKTPKK